MNSQLTHWAKWEQIDHKLSTNSQFACQVRPPLLPVLRLTHSITFSIEKTPELISNDGTMPHCSSRAIPTLIIIAVIKNPLTDHAPQDMVIGSLPESIDTTTNFIAILSGTHCQDP